MRREGSQKRLRPSGRLSRGNGIQPCPREDWMEWADKGGREWRRGLAGKVIKCIKGPEVGASLVDPGLSSYST